MKRIIHFIIILTFLIAMPQGAASIGQMRTVFLNDTDYELHVYRIYGKKPGKTMMLLGGIQGNEPGGFHSADLYTEISLAKGNLIVVPRANFKSILLNRRQINEDMNRKFGEDTKQNYEAKIVKILKSLIAESDILLNLHDGSGFYSDKWESSNRNPMKYGQSIIADTDVYKNSENRNKIKLGDMARAACKKVNKEIQQSKYHYRFNNHKTRKFDSLHKEQRKSATYYALYNHDIPAFGIEANKSLPLHLKITFHKLIINEFMKQFDIITETPGMKIYKPQLKYLVVDVNDALPVVLKNKQTLYINPGDEIVISHIEANYERGLTADIKGYGSLNDTRKRFVFNKPATVIVKKDSYRCGSIKIKFGNKKQLLAQRMPVVKNGITKLTKKKSRLKEFKIRRNGNEHIVKNYSSMKLIKGDKFEIVQVITDGLDVDDLQVNFKGYVGDSKYNSGEDRGYIINTEKDLMKRFSLGKKGKKYEIIVSLAKRKVGRMVVDIEDASR